MPKAKKLSLERRVREILRNASDVLTAWKLPTDFRWTKNGVVHGEPMPADFMGYRHKDGRAFFVECKSVERSRLPLGDSPGLSPFQVQAAVDAYTNRIPYLLVWERPKLEMVCVWWLHEEAFKHPSLKWPNRTVVTDDDDSLRALIRDGLMER